MTSLLRALIREALEEETVMRQPLNIPIPSDLQDIHGRMKYAGRELYLVGGAVRDTLMGKTPKDYDVATNASPEEVIRILNRDSSLRLDLTGKQFGVVRVKTKDGGEYEIATFREDIGKGKGTSVKFSTIENDVRRRDLTINALFYDMDSGEVVDYVGGIEDIKNGVIRAVGEPGQRFDEDRIRILRAVRFAARMGSELDPATKQAILEDNDLIDTETGDRLPVERITEEFVKGIKSAQDVNHFLRLNKELGLFRQIFPGLDVKISSAWTNDPIAEIAAILIHNSRDVVTGVLKNMKYSNDEQKVVRFLLGLMAIRKETAPSLKKDFQRFSISVPTIMEFVRAVGSPPESTVQAFLEFAEAPPAADARELMAQGLKGPEIGKAMLSAEEDAYATFLGELRVYIRGLLTESEVKFAGILKLIPGPDVLAMIESLLSALPPEAVPLPADRFHVTLVHQSILKPYRKQLKQLSKAGMLPSPPSIVIDPHIDHRIGIAPGSEMGRQSWVVWVKNQGALANYVNEVMELVGGLTNPEPGRVYHISLANLTGNPGDSVR